MNKLKAYLIDVEKEEREYEKISKPKKFKVGLGDYYDEDNEFCSVNIKLNYCEDVKKYCMKLNIWSDYLSEEELELILKKLKELNHENK